jgi:Xaa-Pro aminopeptidase
MLDEVAWLFNLAWLGYRLDPVFFAYAVVSTDHAQLFVDPAQLSQDVRAQLGQVVQLHPYDEFFPYLK